MLKNFKNLNSLPQESRVWVFPSTRAFSEQEVQQIQAQLDVFLFQWAAHGSDLLATGHILYDRFIVVMLDETKVGASGCSIDALVRFTQKLETQYATSFTDRMRVNFIEDDNIKDAHLNDVSGYSADLKFFNHLVNTKDDFENNWLTTVRSSWLERFI